MAIAAVPAYLGQDFSTASPGLRFGMYLQLWGVDRRTGEMTWETRDCKYEMRGQDQQERRLPHENKVDAINKTLALTKDDVALMKALQARQSVLAEPLMDDGSLLAIHARAVAPFTTGLGNEHPLENGFAFLNPYGLPYLPGSGVKGVLRQAARERRATCRGVSMSACSTICRQRCASWHRAAAWCWRPECRFSARTAQTIHAGGYNRLCLRRSLNH